MKPAHNSPNLRTERTNQGGEFTVGAIKNCIREIMIRPLITFLCSELRSISTVCFIQALSFFLFKEDIAWLCKYKNSEKLILGRVGRMPDKCDTFGPCKESLVLWTLAPKQDERQNKITLALICTIEWEISEKDMQMAKIYENGKVCDSVWIFVFCFALFCLVKYSECPFDWS